ncbi:hypothetical protein F2Q69_00036244 [Brassica cretica]|uniref:Uncharacterized protein n=1 Tax=Brassica cretica TaxID=69181 RepID=A0A8S9SER9_BRACR|nr:hypothetical protein F2Q69_00036244 [Brassica cretica]
MATLNYVILQSAPKGRLQSMLGWPCVVLSWNLEDPGHVFPESEDLEIHPSETHGSWMRSFINRRLYGLSSRNPETRWTVVSIDMNSPTKDPWNFIFGPEAVYNPEVFYEPGGRFEPGRHFWTRRLCGNPEFLLQILRSYLDTEVMWTPGGSP